MEESLEPLLTNYSEDFKRFPVKCVGIQVCVNTFFGDLFSRICYLKAHLWEDKPVLDLEKKDIEIFYHPDQEISGWDGKPHPSPKVINDH